jgi:hypothetical protein
MRIFDPLPPLRSEEVFKRDRSTKTNQSCFSDGENAHRYPRSSASLLASGMPSEGRCVLLARNKLLSRSVAAEPDTTRNARGRKLETEIPGKVIDGNDAGRGRFFVWSLAMSLTAHATAHAQHDDTAPSFNVDEWNLLGAELLARDPERFARVADLIQMTIDAIKSAAIR